MADLFTWPVRFLHILAGVVWVGGNFLWGMLIAPNVLQRGPPFLRRPFLEATLHRLTRYMIIAGLVTILSGFWVMGLLADGWGGIADSFRIPGYGTALGIGAVAAIAMFLEGLFVIKPAGERMLALMQSMPAPVPGEPPAPPPAEVPALGKKLAIASMTSILLGTIALGAMAWAVNVVR